MGERYRREGETSLIEIKLNSIQQLFNSLDPSPFHEKDLDADAEDYIVGAAREFATHAPLKLVLHLPADHAAQAETAGLAEAIHNYFAYRRDMTLRDLRFQLHLAATRSPSVWSSCSCAWGCASSSSYRATPRSRTYSAKGR